MLHSLARGLAVAALTLALALAGLLAAPRQALAYGVGTHTWLAEEEASRLAAQDPSLAFLVTDPEAHACFLYGAIFPDVRSIARQISSFAPLKAKVMGTGLVASVNFSTDEVDQAFANIDTHDCAWILTLVAAADASGDRMKRAFALGNLAHVMMDKYSQVIQIPEQIQRHVCGDLGVEPTQDPTTLPAWHPGVEDELWFDGTGDFARPQWALLQVKDAPWRLVVNNPSASYQRALALRHFWWETAAGYVQSQGKPAMTERSVMNAAKVFELSLTFYAYFTANESIDDAMRSFLDRYVTLQWWAAAINGAINMVAANLLGASDLLDVVGPIAQPFVGGQVGGQSITGDILYGSAHGGADWARVVAKYGANPEFQKLVASGFADRATYASMSYEMTHVWVIDGLMRRSASQFTDDTIWPRYSVRTMRAACIRSLLRASGKDGVAEAPSLLLWDLRAVDRATGVAFDRVNIPQDAGKVMRIEAEVFGGNDRPEARIVRVRLRADVGAGAAGDPVLASRSTVIGASSLDMRSYGSIARPIASVEWTVADVPGAVGVYFEVDERRLSPVPDEDAADALFTSHMGALQPLMTGLPHYGKSYATYDVELSSLRIKR